MILVEYLDKIRRSRALTNAECRVLGIPYPPVRGWVGRYGKKNLSEDQVEEMRELVRKRRERRAANKVGKAEKKPKRQRIKDKPKSIPSPTLDINRIDPNASDFLMSYEWRVVRMMALEKYGSVCQCCGASPRTGAVMNVDHIKPRRLFPTLALDVDNLQILCHECNHGKSNWSQTDWRESVEPDLVLSTLNRIKKKA